MDTMKRSWLFLGGGLLVLSVAVGAIGWLMRDWRLKIGAEPQTITAAQLAAQGPGDNHYVRITDFDLGPTISQRFGHGTAFTAWIAIYPRGQASGQGPPPIIFQHPAEGQADVDMLRAQPVLEGIVGNGMSVGFLPPMLLTLQTGGTVSFGWAHLSGTGIGYKDTALPWIGVSTMKIVAHLNTGQRHLNVYSGGLLPEIMVDLNAISNDWLFLEVLKTVCPRHLLVAR
jgi:hypothetical protein